MVEDRDCACEKKLKRLGLNDLQLNVYNFPFLFSVVILPCCEISPTIIFSLADALLSDLHLLFHRFIYLVGVLYIFYFLNLLFVYVNRYLHCFMCLLLLLAVSSMIYLSFSMLNLFSLLYRSVLSFAYLYFPRIYLSCRYCHQLL